MRAPVEPLRFGVSIEQLTNAASTGRCIECGAGLMISGPAVVMVGEALSVAAALPSCIVCD